MFLLANPNFLVVLLSATVFAIPMPLLIILGGLSGILLAPDESLATLPVSVQLLAGLFTITPISLFMGSYGRKAGFLVAAGFLFFAGVIGAYSLIGQQFYLLCVAHALLGAAIVSFNLFRFAAAELVKPSQQATAMSITLGSGLVAALLAPEVFRFSKDALAPFALAGSYGALSVLSLAGALILSIARFAPPASKTRQRTASHRSASLLHRPRLLWAIVCGSGSAAGMTLLMTPTPLAMVGCGFSDLQAGDVIRWHVIAMFAPSFVTGSIINRIGANKVVMLGAILMLLSGIVALLSMEIAYFYISLILLGVGWNFGFVGASAMLNSELEDSERPLFQGINDTFIALGGATASFASGLLITSFTWALLAIILIGLAFVVGISSVWQSRSQSNVLVSP